MKKAIFQFILVLFGIGQLCAQQRNIRVTVLDEHAVGMPGANVIIKGTTRGTVTDVSGKGTIQASPEDNLVINFIGYEKQVILVGNQKNIKVSMVQSNIGLDEVIAVGYGTQKKGSLTGSISAVDGEVLRKVTVADATNALTGRTAGVRVTQYSSKPGAYDSDFDIRGMGTPLIIIDNMPSDKATFSRLSTTDIENISVLKDGAAAVYGVQGANGVVLVTTKRGEKGAFKVSYNGSVGTSRRTAFPETVGAFEYVTMLTEEEIARSIANWEDPEDVTFTFTPEIIEQYRNGELPFYNHMESIMKEYVSLQNHNVSIRGGGDRFNVFSSFGYTDDNGIWEHDGVSSDKYNFRTNLDLDISKNLSFKTNLAYIKNTDNSLNYSDRDIIAYTWQMLPTEEVYANGDPDYLLRNYNDRPHPFAMVDPERSGYRHVDDNRINSQFALNYKVPFVKGLSVEGVFGYNMRNFVQEDYGKMYNTYEYDVNTDTYNAFPENGPSTYSEVDFRNIQKTYRFQLNYSKKIKKHQFKLMALAEQTQAISYRKASAVNLKLEMPTFAAGDPDSYVISQDPVNDFRRVGYVGRLNYSFANKYLLEATARYDGSTKFASSERWGFFPNGSIGWVISEENFLKGNKSFLNFLKIRASAAQVGYDGAADNFQFLSGYTYPNIDENNNEVYSYFGNGMVNGVGINVVSNNGLTWYTSEMYNLALEAILWDGKLNVEFDLFRRDRDGLIYDPNKGGALPSTYGQRLPQENGESDRNQGFEIQLGHKNRINEVSYFINGNASFTRNKWLTKIETPSGNSFDSWRNTLSDRYTDILWGYKTEGQFQTFDEIYNHAIIDGDGNSFILPGDIKRTDLNNDGVVDELDRTIIGRNGGKPAMYFGLDMGFTWKNLDLTMLWQGAAMQRTQYEAMFQKPFHQGAAPMTYMWDRWHLSDLNDPTSEMIPGNWPAPGVRSNYNTNLEYWFFNAAYLRLKSVEIGYTLPVKLVKRAGIDHVRFFTNGYNLLTFSNMLKYIDPENPSSRAQGYNYPIMKNINLGVQIEF